MKQTDAGKRLAEQNARLWEENAQLRDENAQLQGALNSRVRIEQAKGLVAGAAQVSMDEAFGLLRSFARNHNRNLHELCCDVIEMATGTSQERRDDTSPSPTRLIHTPLYAEIMDTWRERSRSVLRHRPVPSK